MGDDLVVSAAPVARRVRMFDREADLAMLDAWWEQRGLYTPSADVLPRDGYVAEVADVPVAAAWLYVNNRSDAAHIESLITDPHADAEAERVGRELLVDFLSEQARQIGKHIELDEPFPAERFLALMPGEAREFIDTFEREIRKLNVVDFPLTHRFTPGMYIRQIFMPAGSLILTEKHKTTHPFVVSQGELSVWTAEAGVVRLRAPYTGITTPGTQRIIYIHEDTIWTTFHVTDETDPEVIKNQITEAGERNKLWDSI